MIAIAGLRISRRDVNQTSINCAIELMEATRKDRHILYATKNFWKPFSGNTEKLLPEWTGEELEAADNVSRAFDILGILDSTGNIDSKFVDRFYAIPAIELWDICKDFVSEERKKRGVQHLWEFEQLAKRVENVNLNHPAVTGNKKWPRNPRNKQLHLLSKVSFRRNRG